MNDKGLIKVYYVCSVMMDIINYKLNMIMDTKNLLDKKREVSLNRNHIENHKRLVRGYETMKKAIENLAKDYEETLSIELFDTIRDEANFILRCVLRIYNTTSDVEKQELVEKALKDLERDDPPFMDSFINNFKLK